MSTETANEDDNFGTEQSHKVCLHHSFKHIAVEFLNYMLFSSLIITDIPIKILLGYYWSIRS